MKRINLKIRYFNLIFLTTFSSSLYGIDSKSPKWIPIYEDNYNYSKQTPKNSTFNSWFWREDSSATHYFEYTGIEGCTKDTPCVKLTAQANPANNEYTNSEMYNNSCIKDPNLLKLKQNTWGNPLFNNIKDICDIPYPYQKNTQYLKPFNITSSWNNEKNYYLETNPFALSSKDVEKPWKALRDITFNNPYKANKGLSTRITMDIKAQTKDQGGSRGWGFWNTSLDMDILQLAWFMEYSIPQKLNTSNKANRAVVMQSIGKDSKNRLNICSTVLDPKKFDIYNWHQYKIEWSNNQVIYYVDNEQVAIHDISLKRNMAFHNWVDNRNYTEVNKMLKGISNFPLTKNKSNYIKSFKVETSNYSNSIDLLNSSNECSIVGEKTILEGILKMVIKDYI